MAWRPDSPGHPAWPRGGCWGQVGAWGALNHECLWGRAGGQAVPPPHPPGEEGAVTPPVPFPWHPSGPTKPVSTLTHFYFHPDTSPHVK